MLEVRLESINKGMRLTKEGSRGDLDHDKLRELDKKIKNTVGLIDASKEEVTKMVQEVRDHLYHKAEKSDVEDFENRIVEKLNELVEALYKKFADKAETKKTLKILERQLKNMYELFLN